MKNHPTPAATAEAVQAATAYPKVIQLPSGTAATQTRPLKGRDAVQAQLVAKNRTDVEFRAALVSQVVQLQGKPVVMEDLLELDLADLGHLVEEVAGK
jgi:hypothetical protein